MERVWLVVDYSLLSTKRRESLGIMGKIWEGRCEMKNGQEQGISGHQELIPGKVVMSRLPSRQPCQREVRPYGVRGMRQPCSV